MLLRYIIVGSINTLTGFIFIFAFRSILHFDPYLSNGLSFLCCHFTAFKMHKNYTFGASLSTGSIRRFTLVILLSWLINILTLRLLITAGITEYASQGLAMISYVVVSFFLHRLFTFAWVQDFKRLRNLRSHPWILYSAMQIKIKE